jgi:hypothetical protein
LWELQQTLDNGWFIMKAFVVWLLFLNINSFCRRAGASRANKSFMGPFLTFVTSAFIAGRDYMPENPALFAEARQ